MKTWRLIFYLFCIVIPLSACSFSYPSETDKKEATFTGVIEEINGQSALVTIEEGDILHSGEKVVVDLSVASDIVFQIGQRIQVSYEGEVRLSYPLGINTTSVEL